MVLPLSIRAMSRQPQSQAGPLLLNALPKIAFPLTILISILTFHSPVEWMIEAFARGGTGAHLQDRVPRLGQLTDVRGLGHYERLSLNKWASASHILPSRYLNLGRIGFSSLANLTGLIWLLLWPLQFTTSIRWKWPRVHRWVGTFLLVDGCAVLLGIVPMCTMGICQ
jgi:hypothetical protein